MTFSLSLISTDNLFSRTGRAGNKGYSNTFITPEQARNAMDIIKAFELSESPVPPSLQKLWDDYKEAAKAVSRYLKFSLQATQVWQIYIFLLNLYYTKHIILF